MSSLLVVEDDDVIGRALSQALRAEGHSVAWAHTGAEAETLVSSVTDLVVLDLGLPDVEGVDLCRRLRARLPHLEILILTARREEVDVVVGLDAGADDYLTKPFRLAELSARIRARLRHQPTANVVVEVGALRVDLGARRAFLSDRELELRAKEFDLLAFLAAEAGQAVSRDRIMTEVWDAHWYGSTKTLDIHIAALRRKIDEEGRPSLITTLRGVGYRMDPR